MVSVASPLTAVAPTTGPVMLGDVHVGFGIGVGLPIGHRHRSVARAHGYYTYRTERIWVPRTGVVEGNFSNAHRGIFTTT